VPNKPGYQERANLKRRERRRKDAKIRDVDDILSIRAVPTIDEIKEALRQSKDSAIDIFRLAALMDNLQLVHSPGYLASSDARGRTHGVREYLRADGYLDSRYSTLMRFCRLGKQVRYLLSGDCTWINLLWGIEKTCPEDVDESLYNDIRKFYSRFDDLPFKSISEQIESEYLKKCVSESAARRESKMKSEKFMNEIRRILGIRYR